MTRPADVLEADESAPARPHGPLAALLIAWSPLSLILLCYAVAEWANATIADGVHAGSLAPARNRLGFGLHVTGSADLDRHVFGAVPSVWLQAHLVDGTAHWYDAVAALVYLTHFVAIPVVTGLVWFRLRDRFQAWIAAVLAFTGLGVGGYLLYPAAPPWLASEDGVIGPVHRIPGLGWHYLHLDVVARLLTDSLGGGNPVAAMPSLHAASALLVALFLWPVAGPRWRAVLLGYPLLMGLVLVYTGEHYVADVVAGWLTAAVAVAVGTAVGAAAGHRPGPREPRADGYNVDTMAAPGGADAHADLDETRGSR